MQQARWNSENQNRWRTTICVKRFYWSRFHFRIPMIMIPTLQCVFLNEVASPAQITNKETCLVYSTKQWWRNMFSSDIEWSKNIDSVKKTIHRTSPEMSNWLKILDANLMELHKLQSYHISINNRSFVENDMISDLLYINFPLWNLTNSRWFKTFEVSVTLTASIRNRFIKRFHAPKRRSPGSGTNCKLKKQTGK